MVDRAIVSFMTESLRIEGITREPTHEELRNTVWFLGLNPINIHDLCALQRVYVPDMPLRDKVGLDVRVGRYVAPAGGPDIPVKVKALLDEMRRPDLSPWEAHCRFEGIHPFCDGNGRTGRTLWAWHMLRRDRDPFALSFLHRFYYDTLARMGIGVIGA